MDYTKLENTQNKLRTVKGRSMIGRIIAAAIALCFTFFFAGSFTLCWKENDYGAAAAHLAFTAATAVFASLKLVSIFKEREMAIESWARLTPEEVGRIEQEAPDAAAISGGFVTSDAVVAKMSLGPVVFPARDIVWVYGKKVSHTLYGVIPIGSRCSTIICDRYGSRVEIPAKKATADDQVRIIRAKLGPCYPGIFFGYSKEIEDMVKKGRISELAEYVDKENRRTGS